MRYLLVARNVVCAYSGVEQEGRLALAEPHSKPQTLQCRKLNYEWQVCKNPAPDGVQVPDEIGQKHKTPRGRSDLICWTWGRVGRKRQGDDL